MDKLIYPPLTSIRPSPFNYRRQFRPAYIQELAESIKARGVLQPIKVRAIPDAQMDQFERYEIIFGECRYRASKVADQEFIPAVLTEMSDDEVRLAQLAENMQREDTTPLEEAEAMAHLVRARTIRVEQIARDTGKSRSHIYATISLLKLNDAARAAVDAGTIGREIGVLIAGLPNALQTKALELVTPASLGGEALSYRAAKVTISTSLTKDLKTAPFDITRVGLVEQLHACSNCPNRAANNPALAGSLPDDTCTDSQCFASKIKGNLRLLASEHKANGGTVLEGEAAEEAKPHAEATWFNGYKPLTAPVDTLAKKPLAISQVIAQMEAEGIEVPKAVLHVDDRTNTATKLIADEDMAKVRDFAREHNPEAVAQANPAAQQRHARPVVYESPLHQFAATQHFKIVKQCRTALLARERDAEELRWCLAGLLEIEGDVEEELLQHLGWEKAVEQAREQGQEIDHNEECEWLLKNMLPQLSDYQVATALVYTLMSNAPWGYPHPAAASRFAQDTLAIAAHYGIDVQAQMEAAAAATDDADADQDDQGEDDDEGGEA